ncbi:MAG: hypothetical protein D6696_09445, partial [Acidobacteria bacterium]
DPPPPPPPPPPEHHDPSELPAWVPRYPTASDLEVPMARTAPRAIAGAYTFTTTDEPAAVLAHYQRLLEGAGYGIERQMVPGHGGRLIALLDGGRRNVNVAASSADGPTKVVVQYQERRQPPPPPEEEAATAGPSGG